MSDELIVPEEVSSDIDLIVTLDTPEKRFSHLSRSFTTAIVIIAEMQKQRDWEHLTKNDGTPYKSLTDMIQDALGISDSYARRLVQTSSVFYTPLEAVTVEGTVINITANEAAKLGSSGMDEVVQKAEPLLKENQTPEEQAAIIDTTKKEVIDTHTKSLDDDFDDDDFEDLDLDLDDDFDDDDDLDSSSTRTPSKSSAKKESSDDESRLMDFDEGSTPPPPETKPKKKEEKQSSVDYLAPIEKIMSGGKEYLTDEAIAELPEELQEFVRAVNYLNGIDSLALSEMITEERRGVTYHIQNAKSNLTLVMSATETSTWVLEQI